MQWLLCGLFCRPRLVTTLPSGVGSAAFVFHTFLLLILFLFLGHHVLFALVLKIILFNLFL